MVGIAAAVILAGYTVTWYGREMLRGCRPSWSELLVPGRYVGCHDATGGDAKHNDGASAPAEHPPVKSKGGDFGGGGASGSW